MLNASDENHLGDGVVWGRFARHNCNVVSSITLLDIIPYYAALLHGFLKKKASVFIVKMFISEFDLSEPSGGEN